MSSSESCSLVYNKEENLVQCVGFPTIQPQPILAPTSNVLTPLSGLVQFDVDYINHAEPAVDATRFNELKASVDSYLADFANSLAPHVTSSVVVKTQIRFAALSTFWNVTVQTDMMNMDRYMEIYAWSGADKILLAGVVYPLSETTVTINFNYDSMTGVGSITFPGSSSVNFNILDFLQTGLNYGIRYFSDFGTPVPVALQKNGTTQATLALSIFGGDGGQIQWNAGNWINVNQGPFTFPDLRTAVLAQARPFANTSTGTSGVYGAPSGKYSLFPGVTVTNPATTGSAQGFQLVGGAGSYSGDPIIFSSQWRFMRTMAAWTGDPLKTTLDAVFTGQLDIEVTVSADQGRMVPGDTFDFADSYTSSLVGKYSFKGVLIHELHHGLTFASVPFQINSGSYTTHLYNHWLFDTNVPTMAQFNANSVQRRLDFTNSATSTRFGISELFDISINNGQSHLGPGSPGIMQPVVSTPGAPPTANDMNVLKAVMIDYFDVICVAGDTRVATPDGARRIDELRRGDRVISADGAEIEVVGNLKFLPNHKFILLPKHSIADGQPSRDLLIRAGHPLLIDGVEVFPEQLLGRRSCCSDGAVRVHTTETALPVWSLKTDRREFVLMNNLPVATWSRFAVENFLENDALGRNISYEEF